MNIMLPLRVCYLENICTATALTGECHLPGGKALLLTGDKLYGLMFEAFNTSFISKSRVSKGDGEVKVDGCLLALQNNDSDVVSTPYSMPVMLDNIDTGPVAFEATIGMMSTYQFQDNDNPPGILGTFRVFSIHVYALILCFMFLMYFLIVVTYLLDRKILRPEDTMYGPRLDFRLVARLMLSYFVKQNHSWPGDMTVNKGILFCCLMTLSYFVTFYYSSMIKTEMVTVQRPQVIATYQDILDDPKIETFMLHFFDEYYTFKSAPTGSLKNKIWDRIITSGIQKYIIQTNNPQTVFDFEQALLGTKGVLIAYSNSLKCGKYLSKIQVKDKNRKVFHAFDPTEQPVNNAYVINKFLPSHISFYYRRRMLRIFESDISAKLFDELGQNLAIETGPQLGLGQDISNADSYVSQQVLLPDSVVIKPGMKYFQSLFILYIALVYFAFVILVFEIFIRHWLK